MKIYNLPMFSSTLEFLTMFALSTGRLLKVSPVSIFSPLKPNALSFVQGGTPNTLSAARQVLVDWNHQKIPFFSEPPTLHAAHLPSTIPGSGGQVAPGAETTGHAQIVSTFGAPFMLEGLFGEADAEAMDADPDSNPATDNAGMDIEDDASAAVAADGGMIVDDDYSHSADLLCVIQLPFFPAVKAVKMLIEQVNGDFGVPLD
jgi:nuclear GTP-binding protein